MAEDTLKDISKYIGETTEYDKKQEVEHRKVKSWLKSVSAFANGEGRNACYLALPMTIRL